MFIREVRRDLSKLGPKFGNYLGFCELKKFGMLRTKQKKLKTEKKEEEAEHSLERAAAATTRVVTGDRGVIETLATVIAK